MDKEITTKEGTSIDVLLSQAVEKGVPVETMERLLAMRKEINKENAKAAYVKALAQFQKDCPEIKKTKKVMNKDGQTVRYMYAPLEDIISGIKELLAKQELSYTWDVEHSEKGLTAIAKITHSMGHSETSKFQVPIDTGGFMTAPQKSASALTFAKRYSLCNALGISTGDEDDDANTAGKEPDAKSEKSKIILLLRRLDKPTKTKDEIEDGVQDLTSLGLEEKNFEEIINRLEVLVLEKEGDKDVN